MDETLKHVLRAQGGALVRWLLVFAGAWLVRKGVTTDEQAQAFVKNVEPVLTGLALALAALAWSFYQKWRTGKKIERALELPAGTPPAALDKKT